MSDEHIEDADEPMPTRAKIIAGLIGSVIMIAVAWGMVRVSSPALRADQPAPSGHYAWDCALCHAVSADTAATDE